MTLDEIMEALCPSTGAATAEATRVPELPKAVERLVREEEQIDAVLAALDRLFSSS